MSSIPKLTISTFNVLFEQLTLEDQETFLNSLKEVKKLRNEIQELLKEGSILTVYCTICKKYRYMNIGRHFHEIGFIPHQFNQDEYDKRFYETMDLCGIENTGNNSIGLCVECYELGKNTEGVISSFDEKYVV